MDETTTDDAQLRRLAFAMEAAGIGSWEWDVQTGEVWWSDNLIAIHGIDSAAFDGTFEGFLQLIHADDRERVGEVIGQTLASGTEYDLEFRVPGSDGRLRWIQGKGRVFRDDAGDPRRMIGIGQDVTARREAEAARLELAAIVESSADAIVARTLDGIITSWNDGAEHLYGYTAAEVIGQSMAILIPPERADELAENLDQIRHGERVPAYETERLRRDGSRVAVSVGVSPVVDAGGRVVGAATISRDITQQRALGRLQEDFLAMVTHDLSGPLTVLRARAQTLQRRVAYDERSVAEIVIQTERMARLVHDLSDVLSLETGRLEIRRERTDLGALAEEFAAAARGQSQRHEIRVEAPPEPVIGEWDGERLGQVLQNLIGNAVKHVPAGGEVVVRVEAGEGEVLLIVRDDGAGIAPEHLPYLFDRFYRAGSGTGIPGLGMGLYIARMLVEAHGGRIWVESELGRGSTFLVALPTEAIGDRR
ncbi:MAG: two-component system, OmpR family, sensor histidine kinase VicK [Thermomicrobiales bacterium]|nr:two-component system, OmpR family, sensor histidine kinase VicK [Thermomicrobiales bacterium]